MKSYFIMFILTVLFFTLTSTISFAQTDWKKDPNNPVLSPGPTGAWDEGFVSIPSVLFDGSIYRMWYCTIYNSIGYATSADGITWAKYNDPATTSPPFTESDPVLNPGPPGTYDDESVWNPFVLFIDNKYHMWYTGDDSPSSSGHTAICRASSPDGINWVKDTLNPVLDVGTPGTWDDVWISTPCVLFADSVYHMYYSAWNGTAERVRIGHATASHPDSTWTKNTNNPILSYGDVGDWDYPRVDAPNVIFDGSIFHMWFAGGAWYQWKIGYAWSTDGSYWNKYNNNPVLDWGAAGTWDDYGVAFCSVLLDTVTDTLKMWYSGADALWSNHVGYATAPVDSPSTSGIKVLNENLPQEYVLNQNYPNPFNPSTKIEFTLPKSEFVELKVYNILGKEVVTLVSNKLNQGNHTYQFDVKNLASGVYYYQLVAGDYKEVKKMILLR